MTLSACPLPFETLAPPRMTGASSSPRNPHPQSFLLHTPCSSHWDRWYMSPSAAVLDPTTHSPPSRDPPGMLPLKSWSALRKSPSPRTDRPLRGTTRLPPPAASIRRSTVLETCLHSLRAFGQPLAALPTWGVSGCLKPYPPFVRRLKLQPTKF